MKTQEKNTERASPRDAKLRRVAGVFQVSILHELSAATVISGHHNPLTEEITGTGFAGRWWFLDVFGLCVLDDFCLFGIDSLIWYLVPWLFRMNQIHMYKALYGDVNQWVLCLKRNVIDV